MDTPLDIDFESDNYSGSDDDNTTASLICICERFNGEHIRKATSSYVHYFATLSQAKISANADADFCDFIANCIEQDPTKRSSSQRAQNSIKKSHTTHTFIEEILNKQTNWSEMSPFG